MSKKKEDLHIALLKFGRDKLENGITFEELCQHIKNRGYEVSDERLKAYFWDNYETLDRQERGSPSKAIEKGLKFSLTVESTFRLIEYEEFKSANRSSRIATRFATAALIVSILAIAFSIYFSNKQLDVSTKIDQDQLNRILQLKFNDSKINQSLAEIIEMQKLQVEQLKARETDQQDKHNQANSADAKSRAAD